ncbi:MAG: hypothetical protein ACK4M6_15000 [Hyphomonas sp.]
MRKIASLLLMASLIAAPLSAQPRYSGGNEPVTLSATGTDPCSAGVIADQGPEGAVGVFPGPSMELEITEYVAGGTAIWVCETSIDGDMRGIIYANFPDTDCEVSAPVKEDVDYIGPCESGWVEADTVELLAG